MMDIPNSHEPEEHEGFYPPKKPNEGYEVYGINPTSDDEE